MLGLSVGSFLNVCIYRMPRDLSIVKPRSYCPHCHQPIKFYQNIPLISFILQKGKCAGCEKNISWRYPLVELISGILTLAIFFIFGFSIDAIMYSVFCYALIVVTFIDIDFRVIPDIISVGGCGRNSRWCSFFFLCIFCFLERIFNWCSYWFCFFLWGVFSLQ